LPASLPIRSFAIPNVGASQKSRTVIQLTDAADPNRIAYDKGDADGVNQASTRVVAQESVHWAVAITVVVCGIFFSVALIKLFLWLSVSKKIIEYLSKRRNQRDQTESNDGRLNSDNNDKYASDCEYDNSGRSGTQEHCDADYDGYYCSDREPWYEVLEVSAKASAEEIKRAWHEKVQKNHPDRVANLDLEFKILADQRTKKLNNARDQGLNNVSLGTRPLSTAASRGL
jgi:DnaJ-domain-containing protein 1